MDKRTLAIATLILALALSTTYVLLNWRTEPEGISSPDQSWSSESESQNPGDLGPQTPNQEILPEGNQQQTQPIEEPSKPPTPKNLTVMDSTGGNITVNLPVRSIVSLNPGLTEVICALGCEQLLIGRSASCNFPPSVLDKPVMGSSSYSPNVELIVESKPDLLVADTMLSYNKEVYNKLRDAGITVIVEINNSTRIKKFIEYMGIILNRTERAKALLDFTNYYELLVINRVKGIPDELKPRVYSEWHYTWRSFGPGSVGHLIIVTAGGLNIASETGKAYPTLSPEFVSEKDPDVILIMLPGELKGSLEGFVSTRDEVLSRPALTGTRAVETGRVYVYDSIIYQGIRYPVGLLYFAKWFHPELFRDIDPGQVHSELISQFFGVSLEGIYVYPP
jgi:iron complex transport system substrate-binding protein